MNRDGFRLVGEGDDGISPSEWGEPISNYPTLLSIHSDCESHGFEFPVGDLSDFLLDRNVLSQPLSNQDTEDLAQLLEALLGDEINIHREHYDQGTPGASGVYYRAYLKLEGIVAVESVLKLVEHHLDQWSKLSGLAAAVKAHEEDRVSKKAKAEEERRLSVYHALEHQALTKRQWEEELFKEIRQSLISSSPRAFARLHFMVFRGRVFFLEKQGWWHSIGGDPLKVLEMLERSNVPITKVKIKFSSKGRIPHFGRSRPEERGLGRNDCAIQLDGGSVADDALIVDARNTLML